MAHSSSNANALPEARLNVLRAVLAEVTNASKSPKPVKSDVDLLSILRKRAASSRASAAEFAGANRPDLQKKENNEVDVLDEYASEVELVGEQEMIEAITEAISRLQNEGKPANVPSTLKLLVGPEGSLSKKPVDKGSLASLVKSLLP